MDWWKFTLCLTAPFILFSIIVCLIFTATAAAALNYYILNLREILYTSNNNVSIPLWEYNPSIETLRICRLERNPEKYSKLLEERKGILKYLIVYDSHLDEQSLIILKKGLSNKNITALRLSNCTFYTHSGIYFQNLFSSTNNIKVLQLSGVITPREIVEYNFLPPGLKTLNFSDNENVAEFELLLSLNIKELILSGNNLRDRVGDIFDIISKMKYCKIRKLNISNNKCTRKAFIKMCEHIENNICLKQIVYGNDGGYGKNNVKLFFKSLEKNII